MAAAMLMTNITSPQMRTQTKGASTMVVTATSSAMQREAVQSMDGIMDRSFQEVKKFL